MRDVRFKELGRYLGENYSAFALLLQISLMFSGEYSTNNLFPTMPSMRKINHE